jgi:hypothetical protein
MDDRGVRMSWGRNWGGKDEKEFTRDLFFFYGTGN